LRTQGSGSTGAAISAAGASFAFRGMDILLVRKPYRRSISMSLQVSGRVRVTCPKSISDSRLVDFLEKHVDWLESNLRKYNELRALHPAKTYRTGDVFLFMGRELKLHLMPGGSKGDAEIVGDRLVVYVPMRLTQNSNQDTASSNPEIQNLVRDLVSAFYQKQGRKLLGERLKFFSSVMTLHPSSVSYRSQKTRWGSCSSRGKISLNWRLIFAPLEVIDYVVIHELSHLRHYNHSASFWNLVATQSAGYDRHKKWLRDHQYDADFLAKSSELYPQG